MRFKIQDSIKQGTVPHKTFMRRVCIIFLLAFLGFFVFCQKTNAADEATYTLIQGDNLGLPQVALGIDSNSKIHIVFAAQSGANQILKYATNTSGNFQTETIDSSGSVGSFPSLALDSDNKAHISYYDSPNHLLKYATNILGYWVTSEVDSTARVGKYSSIALGWGDTVHISYYDEENKDLKYATKSSGGSWQLFTLDNEGNVGKFTSLALDGYYYDNKVHISYYDETNHALDYITNISGNWQKEVVDSTGNVGAFSSLACDSDYKVHIGYYDATNGDLKYANNILGYWAYNVVESNGDVGRFSKLALDSDNKTHILYYDNTNQVLKYASNIPGSWINVQVDSVGNLENYGFGDIFPWSAGLDTKTRIHLSYFDWENNTSGLIKYTFNSGPTNLKVKINFGASVTQSRYVRLSLSAKENPCETMISERSDFWLAEWEPYQKSKNFTLSKKQGKKTLYLKFRDQWHAQSDVVSASIKYLKNPVFVTKKPKKKEVLIEKKRKYLVNDVKFKFSALPKKLQKRKYSLEFQIAPKYHPQYSSAQKSSLKKYWVVKTNLNTYKATNSKDAFNLVITFKYKNKEFKALKKQNLQIREPDLVLKSYDFQTKRWGVVAGAKHNSKENIFTVRTNNIVYPVSYVVIGAR